MENELEISFEGDHIKVIANGVKDYEFARRVYTGIHDACIENSCFKVLGIGKTTRSQSTLEAFDNARLWKDLGFTFQYRIAWVELNSAAMDTAQFIETVLINRGFPVRLFNDIEDARQWLFKDGG
jgi:hypothetical protein